jgi:hypothetical protein
MRSRAFAAVTIAALLLTGCATVPPGTATPAVHSALPTPDELTETERTEIAAGLEADALARLTHAFPEATIPAVARERFIDIEDYAEVMAQCLNESGLNATAESDGGFVTEIPTGQEEAYAIGDYTCHLKFPVDPRYFAPLNESQLTYLYDYLTGELTDCLETNGYDIEEPPTREAFSNSEGDWSPYTDLNPPGSLWASLEKQCPQSPEGLFGTADTANQD